MRSKIFCNKLRKTKSNHRFAQKLVRSSITFNLLLSSLTSFSTQKIARKVTKLITLPHKGKDPATSKTFYRSWSCHRCERNEFGTNSRLKNLKRATDDTEKIIENRVIGTQNLDPVPTSSRPVNPTKCRHQHSPPAPCTPLSPRPRACALERRIIKLR